MIIGQVRAATGGVFGEGTLVYVTTTTGAFTNSTDVAGPFDTELRDVNNLHDNVTNNSRFTIPAALNGKVCILFATIAPFWGAGSSQDVEISFRKNGSNAFDGNAAYNGTTGASNKMPVTIQSAPLVVATNDFFEVYLKQTSGVNANTQQSQFETSFGLFLLA